MDHSSSIFRDRLAVKEIDPVDAFEKLVVCEKSYLVDVRSEAEWNFVGFPHSAKMKNEVIFCEWSRFPRMTKNLKFLDDLIQKINIDATENLYFLCRSGVRSFQAALDFQNFINHSFKEIIDFSCINVRYGFEGDLSKDYQRGKLNGWKHSELPWKQL